jgi:hypothetical protein
MAAAAARAGPGRAGAAGGGRRRRVAGGGCAHVASGWRRGRACPCRGAPIDTVTPPDNVHRPKRCRGRVSPDFCRHPTPIALLSRWQGCVWALCAQRRRRRAVRPLAVTLSHPRGGTRAPAPRTCAPAPRAPPAGQAQCAGALRPQGMCKAARGCARFTPAESVPPLLPPCGCCRLGCRAGRGGRPARGRAAPAGRCAGFGLGGVRGAHLRARAAGPARWASPMCRCTPPTGNVQSSSRVCAFYSCRVSAPAVAAVRLLPVGVPGRARGPAGARAGRAGGALRWVWTGGGGRGPAAPGRASKGARRPPRARGARAAGPGSSMMGFVCLCVGGCRRRGRHIIRRVSNGGAEGVPSHAVWLGSRGVRRWGCWRTQGGSVMQGGTGGARGAGAPRASQKWARMGAARGGAAGRAAARAQPSRRAAVPRVTRRRGPARPLARRGGR